MLHLKNQWAIVVDRQTLYIKAQFEDSSLELGKTMAGYPREDFTDWELLSN